MKEIAFRSIFPDNNIPKLKINSHCKRSFDKEIGMAETALSQYADFSKIDILIKEIEFKHLVEADPVAALIQKLQNVKLNDS